MEIRKKQTWTDNELKLEALKYNTRSDFQKYSQYTYNLVRTQNLLDKYCSHMKGEINYFTDEDLLLYSPKYSNKQKLIFIIINQIDIDSYDIQFEIDGTIVKNVNKYDILSGNIKNPKIVNIKLNNKIKYFYHTVYNEALKYNKRSDFRHQSYNEYDFARREGFLDEICSHMEIILNYYSEEDIKNELNKYETFVEFIIKSPNHYSQARRKNLTYLFDNIRQRKIWSDDDLINEANKYSTVKQFYKNSPSVFCIAYRRGILEKITRNLKKFNKIYWTEEILAEKILECESRIEFKRKYPGGYIFAKKNNILDKYCNHMKVEINQYDYPRIIYAYEFPDKSVYIGLTKNEKARKQHRRNYLKDSVTSYKIKTGLKPIYKRLTEFVPAIEAQKLEKLYIDKYKSENWNILNKTSAGALGGSRFMLTL